MFRRTKLYVHVVFGHVHARLAWAGVAGVAYECLLTRGGVINPIIRPGAATLERVVQSEEVANFVDGLKPELINRLDTTSDCKHQSASQNHGRQVEHTTRRVQGGKELMMRGI